MLQRALRRRHHGLCIEYVAAQAQGFATHFCHRGGGRCEAARQYCGAADVVMAFAIAQGAGGDCHPIARPGQGHGGFGADAATGAGDEGDFVTHGCFLLPVTGCSDWCTVCLQCVLAENFSVLLPHGFRRARQFGDERAAAGGKVDQLGAGVRRDPRAARPGPGIPVRARFSSSIADECRPPRPGPPRGWPRCVPGYRNTARWRAPIPCTPRTWRSRSRRRWKSMAISISVWPSCLAELRSPGHCNLHMIS